MDLGLWVVDVVLMNGLAKRGERVHFLGARGFLLSRLYALSAVIIGGWAAYSVSVGDWRSFVVCLVIFFPSIFAYYGVVVFQRLWAPLGLLCLLVAPEPPSGGASPFLFVAPFFLAILEPNRTLAGWLCGLSVVAAAGQYFLRGHSTVEVLVAASVCTLAAAAGLLMRDQTDLRDKAHATERHRLKEQAEILKNQADQLATAKDLAEGRERYRRILMANLTHEIRTPLNGMMGLAQILGDDGWEGQRKELARNLHRSGAILLAVVNDMLDFSKMEEGQVVLEAVSFDLRDAVEDVMDLFGAKAWEKRVDLSYRAFDGVPVRVVGDVTRIRQVLANLVSNAVKFTDSGSVEVRVGWRASKNRLEIDVEDTGIGLSEEQISRLFQLYSQADVSTTRRYGGTGLGLALSKRLAEKMQGDLTVTSREGRGSVFHFTATLRLAKQQEAAESSSLSGHSCLICEPSQTLRASLESMMTAMGVFVVALAELPESFPEVDVVLTSVNLPPPQTNLPWLALAHFSALQDRSEAKDHGAVGVVGCPPRRADLRQALMSVLRPEEGLHTMDEHLAERVPLSILVADDNLTNQQVMSLMLERCGYVVDVVGDGKEAVDAVLTKDYDLILMDLRMPNMDGAQATRTIRELTRVQPTIVIMSAAMGPVERQTCLDAGANRFLDKPVHIDALTRCLLQEANLLPEQPASALKSDAFDKLVLLCDGDIERLKGLVQSFVSNTEELFNTIEEGIKSEDLVLVSRMCHTIKGTAPLYGGEQIAVYMADWEKLVADGVIIEPELGRGRQMFVELCAVLEERLAAEMKDSSGIAPAISQ